MPSKYADRPYVVGKGKPPVHTQFGKDRPGNTKGRPSGSANADTIITKALSVRIQQICNGGALFVQRGEDETIPDAVQRELVERKSPLILVRTMPDNTKRLYRIRDMVVREDLLQPTGQHV